MLAEFSIGGWNVSLSWPGQKKRQKLSVEEETEQYCAALQYATALRLTAQLRGRALDDPAASESAGQCLEQAYLVINSTVVFSTEAKHQARRSGCLENPLLPCQLMSHFKLF